MIFLEILISKRDLKINLRIITKSFAAYPEIGFPKKSFLTLFWLTSPVVSDSVKVK